VNRDTLKTIEAINFQITDPLVNRLQSSLVLHLGDSAGEQVLHHIGRHRGGERADEFFADDNKLTGECIRERNIYGDLVLYMKLAQIIICNKTKAVQAATFAHFDYHGLVKLLLIAEKRGDKILECGVDVLDQRGMLQQVFDDGQDWSDEYRRTDETKYRDKNHKSEYTQSREAEVAVSLEKGICIAVKKVENLDNKIRSNRGRSYQQQAPKEVTGQAFSYGFKLFG
jgi:hypothetical protein